MRLHFLQHVGFEGLAHIKNWADRRSITVSKTALYSGDQFPFMDDFDILVVMGGPMNIYQHTQFPWLTPEKIFIEKAISASKPVLGICLGAQLIADVAGVKIYQNEYKEIGFFDIKRTTQDDNLDLFNSIPENFCAFHWHGETFDIPKDAIHLAQSNACKNQAFQLGDRVLGLQFHLESTPQSIDKLIQNCSDEITDAPYIQSTEKMRSLADKTTSINPLMDTIMDNLARSANQ
jgi:GMP synthase-like glutamine amidotransferase